MPCRQALAIARETGNRNDEGLWLGNLGTSYAALGQTQQAIAHYEQALTIARGITNVAMPKARDWGAKNTWRRRAPYRGYQHALDAVKIGNEISGPNLGSYGNGYLALAHLYSGTYPQAVQLRKQHLGTTCHKITALFPRCWE